jgi:hypothetical protein
VRLEWTVFNVPRPALRVTSSNSTHILTWTGLTNVTYAVQGTTELPGTWATLGKVSANQLNLSFTNTSAAMAQFYRVTVP